MEIKLYENEIIQDIPLVPSFPIEGGVVEHEHDGFNSPLLPVTSLVGNVFQMFFQATAPTSGINTGDYWVDSDDNKIYRYSGTAWVEIQDDAIATAIANAATAQATADGKIYVYKQTTAPTTGMGTGDLWFDTDDGNKVYRYSGSAWEEVKDTGIATAIANAATAQATADGKIVTFIQTTAPTAEGTGDLWMDSDDGYKAYRWSGSAWVNIQDTAIATALTNAATAQGEADRKIVTFFQTSAPTAEQTGDLWMDTDDNNKPYRWSGSAWSAAEFDVATWSKIIGTGKPADSATVNAIFAQTSAPTALATGDIWFDTDDTNKPYRWSGSAWVAVNFADIGATIGAIAGTNLRDSGGVLASKLSALFADLGIITAGTITLDAAGYIRGGQTAYRTGYGWWEGYDTDTYKLSIKGTSGDELYFDGINVYFNESRLLGQPIFGDGSDGNIDINTVGFSSGPITNGALTRDAFFNNLTLSGGGLDTAGYRLFVKGTLTISSGRKIQRYGLPGGNATHATLYDAPGSGGAGAAGLADGSIKGSIAGVAGRDGVNGIYKSLTGGNDGIVGNSGNAGTDVAKSLAPQNAKVGRNGGAGGNTTVAGLNNNGGAGGSGGIAGTKTGTIYNYPSSITSTYLLYDLLPTGDQLKGAPASGGAASGGSGSARVNITGGSAVAYSGATGGGGGGGGNGGIIVIFARKIVNDGGIYADGGSGGNAGSPSSSSATADSAPAAAGGSGGSAGGNGGEGGVIILIYNSYSGSGVIQANGGAGGNQSIAAAYAAVNGGAGSNGENGIIGAAGNNGKIIQLQF